MALIAIFMFLMIPGLAITMIVWACQIGFHANYRMVRGTDRKPLPNPEFVARGFAWMFGSVGTVLLLFSVAIAAFRIPAQAWSAILLLLVSLMALWRGHLLRVWARRRREQAQASTSGCR